jgi:hypothetical protein
MSNADHFMEFWICGFSGALVTNRAIADLYSSQQFSISFRLSTSYLCLACTHYLYNYTNGALEDLYYQPSLLLLSLSSLYFLLVISCSSLPLYFSNFVSLIFFMFLDLNVVIYGPISP